LKEEIRTVLKFLKEADQIARELSTLSGQLPARPRGYVIKARESSLLQKALSAKRARLNLSLQIEPYMGEAINLTANINLTRGSQDDAGRKDYGSGG